MERLCVIKSSKVLLRVDVCKHKLDATCSDRLESHGDKQKFPSNRFSKSHEQELAHRQQNRRNAITEGRQVGAVRS